MTHSEPKHPLVYIGTYTQPLPHVAGRGEGIYACRFNPADGSLSRPVLASDAAVSPSYLAVAPNRRTLYAVQETDEGHNPAVFAFAIEPDGGLRYLNHQPAHGGLPCHVSVDSTGRFVLAANYGAGSVVVFPVDDDGRMRPATDVVRHSGSGPNPARQEGPHAHQAAFGPENNVVFVPDLGLDKIMAYRLNAESGQLVPHDPPFCPVHPGAGPRHVAFHPGGRFAFGINELDATVIVFAHRDGTLTPGHTATALPADFSGEPSGAAIRVSPDGRFVYAANRGHDSIAIFAFDEATATLTPLGHRATQGQTPRDFAIDPAGAFLLAANQDSDTIVTFHINRQTGALNATGHVTRVPNPVCVVFVR
ncbi:MAG: lactonase family protein [Chloroflexi bacterium]|nr:MAG: lactonase family protein [Chloroflexota bacterium]